MFPLSSLTNCIGKLDVCLSVPLKMDRLSLCAVPALLQLLGWDVAVILLALLLFWGFQNRFVPPQHALKTSGIEGVSNNFFFFKIIITC